MPGYSAHSVCILWCMWSSDARGEDSASESLGGGRRMPHPAALYTYCTKGLCAPSPWRREGGRWKVEARENGTIVHNT